jgi:hypothetical protein
MVSIINKLLVSGLYLLHCLLWFIFFWKEVVIVIRTTTQVAGGGAEQLRLSKMLLVVPNKCENDHLQPCRLQEYVKHQCHNMWQLSPFLAFKVSCSVRAQVIVHFSHLVWILLCSLCSESSTILCFYAVTVQYATPLFSTEFSLKFRSMFQCEISEMLSPWKKKFHWW